MLGNVLMFLMTLFVVTQIVRAIRTGELRAKGHVIRRSEYPLPFYLLVGLILVVAAVGLDMSFELGWLTKLVNLGL